MIFVSSVLLKILTGNFASAVALWPFVILRNKQYIHDQVLINHEKIHLRQQLELIIVFFYLWYAIEFVINRIKGMDSRSAYHNIRFEKEAYLFERDLNYLKKRKCFAFLRKKN